MNIYYTIYEEGQDEIPLLIDKELGIEFDKKYKWIADIGITTIDKYNEVKKFHLSNSVFDNGKTKREPFFN